MHFSCFLFTEKLPSDEDIDRILKPYNDENFYSKYEEDEEGKKDIPPEDYPEFMWDWWQVGGRYSGLLKLKVDRDAEDEYRWGFYTEPRAGRLFRSSTLEELLSHSERKWLYDEHYHMRHMGYNDGWLYVDGARIRDLINRDTLMYHCCCFVDPDGAAYARESWDGDTFVESKHFDEVLRKTIEKYPDHYITVIDIHD